jgi:S1-C subfamily serine protease
MVSLRVPTWWKSFVVVVASLAALVLTTAPLKAATLRDVFKRVRPSVVVIHVPGEVGSGTLIDARGLVLTAAHVVEVAHEITVEFLDGVTVSAHVLYSEPAADVALLQLTTVPPSAVPAPLGDSDAVEIGDEVLVIGAPMGVSYTLTRGIISGRRHARQLYGGFERGELFQTDAAINPGNSGGPLLNMSGEVIGVVSHILTESGGSEGLGFAVTANTAKRLLLEQKGFWIGIEGYVLQGELATIFNVPQPVGYAIKRVALDSPAAKIGLRPSVGEVTYKGETIPVGGDILLAVGDFEIGEKTYTAMRRYLRELQAGDTIRLTVLRAGQIVVLTQTF